jgi:hypothetical protein
MSKAMQTTMLGMIALLLVAILATLITIAWRGVRVEHTGVVSLGETLDALPLRMIEPITLQMPEPARLITTGPEGGPIHTDLSVLPCPTCDGTMVPVRWNLWTGELDWICPECGDAVTASPP